MIVGVRPKQGHVISQKKTINSYNHIKNFVERRKDVIASVVATSVTTVSSTNRIN